MRIFTPRLFALVAASLGAAAFSPLVQAQHSSSDCNAMYADAKPCLFGPNGAGLRSSTLTPSTQAPALAISGVLSGGSGRSGGGPRTALNVDGQTGAAAGTAAPKWNAWGALGQNNVGYDFQPARSGGRVNLVMAGIDYTFNNNVILGVVYTDDSTRIGTDFNSGSLSGNGYSIAPYVAVPFARNWVFDASMGWGRNRLSQVDRSAAAAVTGNTTDTRFFSSLAVSYAAQLGKLQWTGKGMYLYSEDKIAQFTQSNNTVVLGSTTRVAQVRLGGQLSLDTGGGVAPYAGLTYIRDVQAPTQPPAGGLVAANDRDAWQLAAGVMFYSRGPLSGSVQYAHDFARSQVKNNTLTANIAYKF